MASTLRKTTNNITQEDHKLHENLKFFKEYSLKLIKSRQQSLKESMKEENKSKNPFLRKTHTMEPHHIDLNELKTNDSFIEINYKPQQSKAVEARNFDRSTATYIVLDRQSELRESDICFENTRFLNKTANLTFKSWGVVLNVIKALNKMKHHEADKVSSVGDIDKVLDDVRKSGKFKDWAKKVKDQNGNLLQYNHYGDLRDEVNTHIDEIQKQMTLFALVSTGCEEDIPKIVKMVQDDPKRNIHDDPRKYFINKTNYKGLTPLYAACRNGHVKVAKALIQNKADHTMKCKMDDGREESCLDVAIRWGHVRLVEYLITLPWSYQCLKNSFRISIERNNEIIIKLVKEALKNCKEKKKGCGCF